MVRMFVRHDVADYAAFRKVYDGFPRPTVSAHAVYQAVDNPNSLTITHDFANLEDAQAFAGSDELKAGMQEAGVVGAPTIWFTTEA